jgi:hypothetical protein
MCPLPYVQHHLQFRCMVMEMLKTYDYLMKWIVCLLSQNTCMQGAEHQSSIFFLHTSAWKHQIQMDCNKSLFGSPLSNSNPQVLCSTWYDGI